MVWLRRLTQYAVTVRRRSTPHVNVFRETCVELEGASMFAARPLFQFAARHALVADPGKGLPDSGHFSGTCGNFLGRVSPEPKIENWQRYKHLEMLSE